MACLTSELLSYIFKEVLFLAIWKRIGTRETDFPSSHNGKVSFLSNDRRSFVHFLNH